MEPFVRIAMMLSMGRSRDEIHDDLVEREKMSEEEFFLHFRAAEVLNKG